MLFLRANEDFVPYTPRDKQNLCENLQGLGPRVQAEDLELAIRKEVRASGVGERRQGLVSVTQLSFALTSPHLPTFLPCLGEWLAARPAHGQPEEELPLPSSVCLYPFPVWLFSSTLASLLERVLME